jgi:hypothetical protein
VHDIEQAMTPAVQYGAPVAANQARDRRRPWDSLPGGVLLVGGLFAIAAAAFVALALVNMTDSEINLTKVFVLPVNAAVLAYTSWGLFAHQRVTWVAALVISVVGSIALWGPIGVIPAGTLVWALLARSSRAWFPPR